MYAVIFKAKVKAFDAEYSETASRLREIALEQYGCLEFISATEDDFEIAISYWENEEAIKRWKADTYHQKAQALGRANWYEDYTVEVVEIKRKYGHKN